MYVPFVVVSHRFRLEFESKAFVFVQHLQHLSPEECKSIIYCYIPYIQVCIMYIHTLYIHCICKYTVPSNKRCMIYTEHPENTQIHETLGMQDSHRVFLQMHDRVFSNAPTIWSVPFSCCPAVERSLTDTCSFDEALPRTVAEGTTTNIRSSGDNYQPIYHDAGTDMVTWGEERIAPGVTYWKNLYIVETVVQIPTLFYTILHTCTCTHIRKMM